MDKVLLIKSCCGLFFMKQKNMKFGLVWASWAFQISRITCTFCKYFQQNLVSIYRTDKNDVVNTYTFLHHNIVLSTSRGSYRTYYNDFEYGNLSGAFNYSSIAIQRNGGQSTYISFLKRSLRQGASSSSRFDLNFKNCLFQCY